MTKGNSRRGSRADESGVRDAGRDGARPAPAAPEFLTLRELCAELSVTPATGRNWVRLGRISPENGRFSRAAAEKLKSELRAEGRKLRSRRNKSLVTGRVRYASYLPAESRNAAPAARILTLIRKEGVELTPDVLRTVLLGAALNLVLAAAAARSGAAAAPSAPGPAPLALYLDGRLDTGGFARLLAPLAPDDREAAKAFAAKHHALFAQTFFPEKNADTLGFLYISLQSLDRRKARGIYYTPAEAARRAVRALTDGESGPDGIVLDPCCGTGNFLLQLPDEVPFDRVYGNDLDPLAVCLARIGLALKYDDVPPETAEARFTVADFLTAPALPPGTARIVGNPPWGGDFAPDAEKFLRRNFFCGRRRGRLESFELFVEAALAKLPEGGILSFIVPESILTVKAHRPVRELIMKHGRVREAVFLGEAFGGVQCPSVILKIEKTSRGFGTKGLRVERPGGSFVVGTDRPETAECFSFGLDDGEYGVVRQMERAGTPLLGESCDFAMGIVTGNNREVLTAEPVSEKSEPVVPGTDVARYGYRTGRYHLEFVPGRFQQCPPPEVFRRPEKLIYRFIGSQPAFAYDGRGVLTLNSANLLLPRAGTDIFFVLAVLNSRPARFYFSRRFGSRKVLRSHLEAVPFPPASPAERAGIRALALLLTDPACLREGSPAAREREELARGREISRSETYELIDRQIAALYGLGAERYERIRRDIPEGL